MIIRFLSPTHEVIAEWNLDDRYTEHTVRMSLQESHDLAYGILAHRSSYLEVRSGHNVQEDSLRVTDTLP